MALKKNITPSQNRHTTFRNERLAGVKKNPLIGKYSLMLTEKKPRNFKKMKKPEELFKDIESRKLIEKVYDHWKREKLSLDDNNISESRADFGFKSALWNLRHSFGDGVLKSQGKELHIFLPLTGSSPSGYFYKACFENFLPKARVTFLVTSSAVAGYTKEEWTQVNANIKHHLQKSLNIHDKQFAVMDLVADGNTTNLIRSALSDVRKSKTDLCVINISESLFRDQKKDLQGKYSIPKSEYDKPRSGLKEYKRAKLDEKVVKYVYYYEGNKYIHKSGMKEAMQREWLK